MKHLIWIALVSVGVLGHSACDVFGQSGSRKPVRVEGPKFSKSEFNNVFFDNVSSVLQGPRPTQPATKSAGPDGSRPAQPSVSNTAPTASGGHPSTNHASGWAALISPTTIEDAVKGSKLRLDKIVTTPAKFAGGGFAEARRQFTLQALMFAIIEQYPTAVRWKSSSAVARQRFARMAANSKVGSIQAYNEAKQRLQDLGELLNGSQLAGMSSGEIAWDQMIDRGPLMQVLEATFKEQIQNHSASSTAFAAHKEELGRAAELVAALVAAALQQGMPDASDDEYRSLANALIESAKKVGLAVQTDNGEAARQAAGQIGQSCVKCHATYQ